MTIEEAYRRLEEAWPRRSWCIGMTVWRHKRREGEGVREVEWSIYDGETQMTYRGRSLESAMDEALGREGDLSEVDGSVGEAIRDHQLEADRFHGRA